MNWYVSGCSRPVSREKTRNVPPSFAAMSTRTTSSAPLKEIAKSGAYSFNASARMSRGCRPAYATAAAARFPGSSAICRGYLELAARRWLSKDEIGDGRLDLLGGHELAVCERRHQGHSADHVPGQGRHQVRGQVLDERSFPARHKYQHLGRTGDDVTEFADADDVGDEDDHPEAGALRGGRQPDHHRGQPTRGGAAGEEGEEDWGACFLARLPER